MTGIITYHSAYNFGSVLQAYATQCVIQKFTDEVEIVNYRMKEQKRFYGLYRIKYGPKIFLKDAMQFPIHSKRIKRKKNFEKFLEERLIMTEEVSSVDEVCGIWRKYDVMVSGSDQIWNKHSNELEHNKSEYMLPYLLHGFTGKKISYASSIANSDEKDIQNILPDLRTFDAISVRETCSAQQLQVQLDLEIKCVLDPTLLLSAKEWEDKMRLKKRADENYVLYYSLRGILQIKKCLPVVKEYAERLGCKVKIITPFVYIKSLYKKNVENCIDAGPEEFMELIYNAKSVVTDSYHGTILSVNLNKEVFSLCDNCGSEFRKTDIMKKLGMERRIIYDIHEILKPHGKIDYKEVEKKLFALREESLEYLGESL
jgi:polysaccharide pyruvyl transferase WcaK-like protein